MKKNLKQQLRIGLFQDIEVDILPIVNEINPVHLDSLERVRNRPRKPEHRPALTDVELRSDFYVLRVLFVEVMERVDF